MTATKILEVHLTGDSAAMQRAFAGASRSAAEAATGMEAAAARMTKAGDKSIAAGKFLTRNVAVPVVGISVLAGKMSVDFHNSMEQIELSAGASGKEVRRMTGAIERLAGSGKVMQGPKELSQALYQIESQGLRGRRAMDALRASANLAAIGNSQLEDTTKSVATAMQTGIKGGEHLTTAIGTLNATVGAGRMHMDDLNAAMGTGFLTSATQVGLSLTDVGGALATLTTQGIPAEAAATRLRQTFTLMAAPTTAAQKALKGIGLDSTDLAETMRKGGLVAALGELKDHLSDLSKVDQTQLLSAAFGGARSGTTIMSLVANLDDVDTRVQAIADHASKTSELLRAKMRSPDFKWHADLAKAETALIKLGDVIVPAVIPVIGKLADGAETVGKWFDNLSPSSKHLAVDIAAVAVAAGPVLSITGRLLKVAGAVTNAMRGMGAMFVWVGEKMTAQATVAETTAATNSTAAAETAGVNSAPVFAAPAAGTTAATAEKTGAASGGAFMTGLKGVVGAAAIGGVIVGGFEAATTSGGIIDTIEGHGETMGATLADGLGRGLDKVYGPKIESALGDKSVGRLQDLRKHLRSLFPEVSAMGLDPELIHKRVDAVNAALAELGHPRRSFDSGLSNLKSGLITTLEDVRSTVHKNMAAIDQGWSKGGEDWRTAVAQNMRGAVDAIRTGMHKGTIETGKGRDQIKELLHNAHLVTGDDPFQIAKGFSDSWKKAGKVNNDNLDDVVKDLKKMPPKARDVASDTMVQMAQTLQSKGQLSENAVSRLRSRLVTEFGKTKSQMVGQAGATATGVTSEFSSMSDGVAGVLGVLEGNVNAALKGFGVSKRIGYTAKLIGEATTNAAGSVLGGVEGKYQGGHITRPTVITGEEAPTHNEWVIAENPAYRPANVGYWLEAGKSLGMIGRAAGGPVGQYQLNGPDPMRTAGQHGINATTQAALALLAKYGTRTLSSVRKEADRMDALHQPYLRGGGHGSMPSKNGPWDCSGGISEMLYGAGWKDLRPMVSGGFENWGLPGKGDVSILASGEHVYGVVGGRAVGTSDSNPGGGFGWVDDYTYRPGFVVRHADLSGSGSAGGSSRGGGQGRGQHQKRGFKSGGKIDWSNVFGSSLDADELATLAHVAGMTSPGLMSQIGQRESRGIATATNQNTNGTQDTGIWQVNDVWGYDHAWLKDPWNNALAAKHIQNTQGLSAWASSAGVGGFSPGKVSRSIADKIRAAQTGQPVGGGSGGPKKSPGTLGPQSYPSQWVGTVSGDPKGPMNSTIGMVHSGTVPVSPAGVGGATGVVLGGLGASALPPEAAGLPVAYQNLLKSPGLSFAAKLGIAGSAIEAAGATEGTDDDIAAYNFQIALDKKRKAQLRKRLGELNAALKKPHTPAEQKKLLGQRNSVLTSLGETTAEITSAYGSIAEANSAASSTAEESTASLTQAIKDLKAAIDQQNKIASSEMAVGLSEAKRALADMIAGELGPRTYLQAQTAGAGTVGSL